MAIARRREVSFAQVAKDFGISETCVQNFVRRAEVDEGLKPGVTSVEHAENRELKKRVRLLEQENGGLRRVTSLGVV